jgi:hypothetical protein
MAVLWRYSYSKQVISHAYYIEASSFHSCAFQDNRQRVSGKIPGNKHGRLCRFRVQSGHFVLWESTRWKRRSDVIAPWEYDHLHQESCNFRTVRFFKLDSCNLQAYFHLLILDPVFICTTLISHSSKKIISKYDFEELRQHIHIILLTFCVSTKLFLHTSPLNYKIFINL